jgi:flagellar biosynthesis/type III secretory pathway chaperone
MKVIENKMQTPHLEKFNSYLIDTIEKIQEQNKKNQIFINKTLLSLKTIREEAMGRKNYSTYNSKGSTKQLSP